MSDDPHDPHDPLRHAIGRLAAGAPDPNWPTGAELRRRATRRRRRRMAGGGLAAVAAVAAVALIVSSAISPGSAPVKSSTGPTTTNPSTTTRSGGLRVTVSRQADGPGSVHLVASVTGRSLPAAGSTTAKALAADETSFALALTKQLAATAGSSNVIDSPLSADVALSMLELGARTSTETGIAKALQSSSLSSGQQAAGWAQLQASLRASPQGDTLNIANSAWMQKSVPFVAAYLAELAQSFGDDAYQTNFAQDPNAAAAAINAWVSKETAGRIKVLIPPGFVSPATILVLANALHFKAPWDPSLGMTAATPESFHVAGGSPKSVPAIATSRQAVVPTAVTSDYTAVALPYKGDRYQALIVEPTKQSLGAYLDHLNTADLAGIIHSLHSTNLALTIPTLSLTATDPLNAPLKAMGMAQAFGPAADLSGISPLAAQVSGVRQVDRLILDKHGTDASAATAIGVTTTATRALPKEISIDRPYLLLLRDTKTGLILMATMVQNPAG